MADIIQIYNRKGGVAKTTSVIQLGGEFSKNFGKRVLLCDFDESGDLTASIAHSEKPEMFLPDMLVSYYVHDIEEDIHGAICRTDFERLDLIPASAISMSNALSDLAKDRLFSPAGCLDPFMEQIEDEYDIILFDCGAGSTDYDLMAMGSADYLLIPTDDTTNSANQARRTISDMQRCKRIANSKLDFMGMYISIMHERRSVSKAVKELLIEKYQEKMIPISIRDGAGIGNTGAMSAPLCYALPSDNVAKDFHKLAKYIIEYIGDGK